MEKLLCINWIFSFLLCEVFAIYIEPEHYPGTSNDTKFFPWLGLLQVTSPNGTVALNGFVVIRKGYVLTIANSLAVVNKEQLRKIAKAIIFTEENVRWECNVQDFIVHPEYDEQNIENTIAVVMIDWPIVDCITIGWRKNFKLDVDNVYLQGYTDNFGSKNLKQFFIKMRLVRKQECRKFYIEEKLDYPTLWPSNCLCFVHENYNGTCTHDPGMALITYHYGTWKLVGLSVLGPGCSLPSRYIETKTYRKWIKGVILANMEKPATQTDLDSKSIGRKSETVENVFAKRRHYKVKESDFESEYADDLDRYMLEKINDTAYVLRPELANNVEVAYGECNKRNIDGLLTYSENTKLISSLIGGYGVYALSLYDVNVREVTCVAVYLKGKARSKLEFWMEKSMQQDDPFLYTKKIPMYKDRDTVNRPFIMYVKDSHHRRRLIPVRHLVFRFWYQDFCNLRVAFFGIRKIRQTTTPEPITNPSTVRTKYDEYFARPG